VQVDQIHRSQSKIKTISIIHFSSYMHGCKASYCGCHGAFGGDHPTKEADMPNWSEMDLFQVDLAALSAEQRGELHAEVKRRARIEQAKAMREAIAWLGRMWKQSRKQPRTRHTRGWEHAHTPRGALDLIFGGRA